MNDIGVVQNFVNDLQNIVVWSVLCNEKEIMSYLFFSTPKSPKVNLTH